MTHPAENVFFFWLLRYLESIISFAVPNRKTRIIDHNYVVGRRRPLNGTRERSRESTYTKGVTSSKLLRKW